MTLLDYYYEGNDDREEGERLRDQAFERLRWSRPVLVRRLQRAFVTHLLANGPDCTDAVRALVPIPPDVDPRVVGYAVKSLSFDHGITHSVGATKTARKVAHRRHLERWAIPDAAKARRWLDRHPDLCAPAPVPDAAPADPADPFAA